MKRQSSADIALSKARAHLQGTRGGQSKTSVGEEDINVYLATLRKKTASGNNPKVAESRSLEISDISMPESSEASSRKKTGKKFLKKKPSSTTMTPAAAADKKKPSPKPAGDDKKKQATTSLMTNATNLIKKHRGTASSNPAQAAAVVERLSLPISDSEFDISLTTTTSNKSSSARKKQQQKETAVDRFGGGSSGSSKMSTPEAAALYQTSSRAKLSYLQGDDSSTPGREGTRFLKKKKPDPPTQEVTTPKTPDRIRFADELHGDSLQRKLGNTGAGNTGSLRRSRSLYSSDDDLGLSSSSGVIDTPKKPSLKKPRTPTSPKKSDSSEASTINEHVTIDKGDHPGSAEEMDFSLDDMMVIRQNYGDDDDDDLSSIKEDPKSPFKLTLSFDQKKPKKEAETAIPSKFDSLIGDLGVQFAEDFISQSSDQQSSMFSARQMKAPRSSSSSDEGGKNSPVPPSYYSDDFESLNTATNSAAPHKRQHKQQQQQAHQQPQAITAPDMSSIHTASSEEEEGEGVSEASSYSDTSRSRTEDTVTYTESRSQSIKRSGDQIKLTTKKSIEIQTTDPGLSFMWNSRAAGEAYLGPRLGMDYVDPTPIAQYAVSAEALDAVTAYSPCSLVLNDLIRHQLAMTQNFVARQKMIYDGVINSISSGYCYTTLEDTKNFIRAHRPKKLTFKEALKEVEREMNA